MNVPWEAIEGLAVYILASTAGFIWWMATQTITLQFVREDLAKANKILSSAEATYATKPELAKEIGRLDSNIQAAHRRIDELKQ